MPQSPRDIPQEGPGDYLRRALKATAGAVPVAGSFLQELVDIGIAAPVAKARDEFLADLSRRLEEVGVEISDLKGSFGAVALSAVQVAMRSIEAEKREYLRNGVVNFALGRVNESDAALLLPYMETLSIRHLIVLDHLLSKCDPPRSYVDLEALRLYAVWECIADRFPKSDDTKEGRYVYEAVVVDLEGRGFLVEDGTLDALGKNRPLKPTYVAKRLMEFIADPSHGEP